MADNMIEALTSFEKELKFVLPMCEVDMCLEVPGAKKMTAATAFFKRSNEDDLACTVYILRHHCINPDFSDLDDADLATMVDNMHYRDVSEIILKFMHVDLGDEETAKVLQQVFLEREREEHS